MFLWIIMYINSSLPGREVKKRESLKLTLLSDFLHKFTQTCTRLKVMLWMCLLIWNFKFIRVSPWHPSTQAWYLSTQAMWHDVCAPAVCAAPVLDDSLQSKGGQVRGPLWISTGEGFSPLGTLEFLMNIKQVIRQKLKNTQFYQKEVGGSRVCF